ncbi:MAG: hypothetical protein DMD26_09320 [Gemmatimonadetes bacterium]|nr:MAG: hypothetical protein DMD26_09320 [Gemmatimonadota bacterium]
MLSEALDLVVCNNVGADESLVTCAPRDKRGRQHADRRGRKSDNSSGTDFTDKTDSTDLLRGAHGADPWNLF